MMDNCRAVLFSRYSILLVVVVFENHGLFPLLSLSLSLSLHPLPDRIETCRVVFSHFEVGPSACVCCFGDFRMADRIG